MSTQTEAVIRADRALAWLWILTFIFGGLATLTVVFAADVVLANLSRPVPPAGVEKVAMSEEVELHHWAIYKAAKEQNDAAAYAHLQKLMGMVTDPKHLTLLDGVLREHLPAGHFIHTYLTMKELLGDRSEPDLTVEQIEAKLGFSR